MKTSCQVQNIYIGMSVITWDYNGFGFIRSNAFD